MRKATILSLLIALSISFIAPSNTFAEESKKDPCKAGAFCPEGGKLIKAEKSCPNNEDQFFIPLPPLEFDEGSGCCCKAPKPPSQ